MPARKSNVIDPHPPGTANPARTSEKPALLRPPNPGPKGNSETHFTRAEFEELLSLPPSEDAERPTALSELVDAAWNRGRVMPEADPSIWRQDACGAWIRREQIGRQTEFGWKIRNLSAGDEQRLEDLRPFHWRNDFRLGSGRPTCDVTADHSGMPGEEHVRPPRNRET